MLTGRYALLEYDVPGPVVIHERMILDHIEADDYVVCTPDRDLFVEQLTVENVDLRSQPNQLPPGVAAARVYGLPAWNAGEIAAIKDEASRLAQTEKAQRGLAQGGGGVPVGGPPTCCGRCAGGSRARRARGSQSPSWRANLGSCGMCCGLLFWSGG